MTQILSKVIKTASPLGFPFTDGKNAFYRIWNLIYFCLDAAFDIKHFCKIILLVTLGKSEFTTTTTIFCNIPQFDDVKIFVTVGRTEITVFSVNFKASEFHI